MSDEKLHAVVARSVLKTVGFGALLEVETLKKCTALWREVHLEVKSVKTGGLGALLEVAMWKQCTALWREAHLEAKGVGHWKRICTDAFFVAGPDRSGHCRASSASARSQWALSDFSCDCQIPVGTAGFSRGCQIAVGTAGLQPRLPDRSVHCRTSAANARSQWALPVGTAGLQPRLPDRSGHCRTLAATARLQWAVPDFNL
eukprot:s103_g39.t1